MAFTDTGIKNCIKKQIKIYDILIELVLIIIYLNKRKNDNAHIA